ncbi:UNVERIFIED_CONTAM: hypothetical protein GTU68_033998 [Idotea baltica]|nr:hypothetical protein [Idotea baltica]
MDSYFFTEEHNLFRQSFRQFLAKEVKPFIDEWEEKREIPREIWKKFGDMGYFGLAYPEEYGGLDSDFFYQVIFLEEIAKCRSGGFGAAIGAHPLLALSHIDASGSEDLKERYLRPGIAGDKFGCLAITEPGAGSDVANIQTKAVRDGDYYILNGSKTFITNGVLSDFLVVAVKTEPDHGSGGISLIVVDRDSSGLSTTKLKKLGWHASDTDRIADMSAKITSQKIHNYTLSRAFNEGIYDVKGCAMAKLNSTELSDLVTYQCLQFFGGYGYMEDFPLARMFRDSRIGTIGGGSSEIMCEIIAKMVIDTVDYKP